MSEDMHVTSVLVRAQDVQVQILHIVRGSMDSAPGRHVALFEQKQISSQVSKFWLVCQVRSCLSLSFLFH